MRISIHDTFCCRLYQPSNLRGSGLDSFPPLNRQLFGLCESTSSSRSVPAHFIIQNKNAIITLSKIHNTINRVSLASFVISARRSLRMNWHDVLRPYIVADIWCSNTYITHHFAPPKIIIAQNKLENIWRSV